ncbi:glycosyltransferase [Neobacillus sp. LXY-4]|uniref:glycosyltransferase n=1 Tax=Neobacillus sp. LXY-4 TaxID=3379826 RepID=UPI003EE056F4
MKIVFFTPYYHQSRGNSTTAKRIVSGLRMKGMNVLVFAYEEEEYTDDLLKTFSDYEVFHILHISRFSRWMNKVGFKLRKPYILTNGGTDVNHDLLEVKNDPTYKQFLTQAAAITVFTEDGAIKLKRCCDHPYIRIIPQSVWFPENEIDVTAQLKKGYPNILLPSGLRRVKDIFYVMKEIIQLRKSYPDLQFIVAGIVIEPPVYEELLQYQQKHPWITFLENVPLEGMKSLYQWADVVINTSISEGQASTLLEAMELGCLVAARRNGGNESIVHDGANGILYSTPEEFTSKLKTVLEDKVRLRDITDTAVSFIRQNHRLDEEIQRYLSVYQVIGDK